MGPWLSVPVCLLIGAPVVAAVFSREKSKELLRFILGCFTLIPVVILLGVGRLILVILWHLAVYATLLRDFVGDCLTSIYSGGKTPLGIIRAIRHTPFPTTPKPVRPVDNHWLSEDVSNPCQIFGIVDLDPISVKALRATMWTGLFSLDFKMLSRLRRIYGRACWVPVNIVNPPNFHNERDFLRNRNRWARGEGDFAFDFDEFFTEVTVDIAQDSVQEIYSIFASEPLKRDRPLWQAMLIQEYNSMGHGPDASTEIYETHLVVKCHHAVTDGIAIAAYMLCKLFNRDLSYDMYRSAPLGFGTHEKLIEKQLKPSSWLLPLTIFRTIQDLFPLVVQNLLAPLAPPHVQPALKKHHRRLTGEKLLSQPMEVPLTLLRELQELVDKVSSGDRENGKDKESGHIRPTLNDLISAAVARAYQRLQMGDLPSMAVSEVGTPRASSICGTEPPRFFDTPAPSPRTVATPKSDFARLSLTPPSSPNRFMGHRRRKTLPATYPVPDTLPFVMAVSCRTSLPTAMDNCTATVCISLPTLRERLSKESALFHIRSVRNAMNNMKSRLLPFVFFNMAFMGHVLIPSSWTDWIMKQIAKSQMALITNVVGPQTKSTLAGSTVRRIRFYPPTRGTIPSALGAFSYAGKVALMACVDTVVHNQLEEAVAGGSDAAESEVGSIPQERESKWIFREAPTVADSLAAAVAEELSNMRDVFCRDVTT